MWHVAYCHPRAEFRAKMNIESLGFECYTPIYRAEVRHARRKYVVERPAFVRYVFVYFEPGSPWSKILSTDGVEYLLMQNNSPMTISEDVINEVKRLEAIGWFDQVTTPSARFRHGETVRISEGPFTGLSGQFIQDVKSYVLVMLEFLGAKRATKIPLQALEKI